ncbi:MucBP domain-containing protein [Limosilactobacillus fastidiosus]|uniref:MucBP domain-containing protein n=1 Tax=Limosilactobacillus fastidiosus TaxID=2759855 RepID=A0A7W3TXW6_9LACO|nr:MucBP domain-containing protein [Limosilactobacillus fastidiosus]MBB1062606.1 MucBP domain-containing protein [Limosilactobacillus fastidiosus]MBB1085329.1 MucBP domain-containing protein [Limosilactobacillus fastidiosus]MCD7083994.1 MucBP domain-containing protein [Limosilactobacillus fastidiosus]MCD7084943.1 MucBP domain-containing protein [Limosilactobacillus fastidiosus]MCD7113743.1 MucBP domain-containing protein [Limosilactobacillus fastidiosus]
MEEKFKTGNPIWVYYTNIDTGENLIVPQLLRGFMGEEYSVEKKQFDSYRFLKSEGDLTGTFDNKPHSVHLYYRNENWGEVEAIEMYLHLDAVTPVYDMPNGMQVGTPFPEDVVLKAFHRVATKSGEFWYEIGSDQWLKYDHMTTVDNPFKTEDKAFQSKLVDNMSVIPIKKTKATIDYLPNRSVDVFERPYGDKVDELKDGQEIIITGKMSDNGEITWYKVGNGKFITSNYVKLEDQDDD